MKLALSALLCQNDRVKKYQHPYTVSTLTPWRMAGPVMVLSVIALVVGAYCIPILSVSDLALWLIARLKFQVWNVMYLLPALPLLVALWQHRQRRRGRDSSPQPGGVMLWLVPMVTIILLLFLFGFWLACSTPFRMVFVS